MRPKTFWQQDTGGAGGGEGDPSKSSDTTAAGTGEGGEGVGDKHDGATHLLDLAKADDTQDASQGDDSLAGDPGQDQQQKADRPDWLPENYWDADKGEAKLEALAKAEKFYRDKVGDGKAPEKAEDYTFDAPEDLKDAAALVLQGENPLTDDPLLSAFTKIAHEEGLSQAAFQRITSKMVGVMGGLVGEHSLDPKAELEALGKNGQAVVDYMATFAGNMEKHGVFEQTDVNEFWATASTANGMKMLQKIMHHFGGPSIPALVGQTASSTATAAELSAKMGELMGRMNSGDPTVEAEYNALLLRYNELYGVEPASSSINPAAS